MKTALTAVTTSILLAGTMTLATTASADGHETIESLKAELSSVTANLENVTSGRDFLAKQITQRMAAARTTQATMTANLESATQERDSLASQLEALQSQNSAATEAHASELAAAKADSDSIAESALVQVQSALAERDAAKAEVVAAQNKNNFAEIMLKKAQSEASASSESTAALAEELATAKAENEKLAMDLKSSKYDVYLAEQKAGVAKSIASSSQSAQAAALKNSQYDLYLAEQKAGVANTVANRKQADLEAQLAASNEKWAKDMESVINGRSFIEKQASAAKADLATANAENEKLAMDLKNSKYDAYLAEQKAGVAKSIASSSQSAQAAALKNSQYDLYLAEQKAGVANTVANRKLADLEAQLAASNEKWAKDMESVINGRSFIEKQAAATKSELSAKVADLESQLAALNKEASMVSDAANWGNNQSAALASQLSYLSGVEVSATDDNKVSLRVGGAGMFKTGGTKLSDQGRYLLEQIGQALRAQPDTSILVTGHTDNIPTGAGSRFKDNVDLSNRRAEAAMNHLGSAAGVDFGRMSFTGIGDSQPIASNLTSEGRRMNRRVEIILSAQ